MKVAEVNPRRQPRPALERVTFKLSRSAEFCSRRELVAQTPAESAEDQQFFLEHPERRYRIGSRWVVRRRGAGVFLRAPIRAGSHADDTERAAEQAWWFAAWPHLDPQTRTKMAKAARRRRT